MMLYSWDKLKNKNWSLLGNLGFDIRPPFHYKAPSLGTREGSVRQFLQLIKIFNIQGVLAKKYFSKILLSLVLGFLKINKIFTTGNKHLAFWFSFFCLQFPVQWYLGFDSSQMLCVVSKTFATLWIIRSTSVSIHCLTNMEARWVRPGSKDRLLNVL